MEFLDERFWLAICFVIFIYISYRPIKKAILNSLDAKISAIKSYLAEAEELKKEAENLLQKTEQQMLKLASLRTEIFSNAQNEVDNLIISREREINKLIERREHDSLIAMKLKQNQAIADAQSELMQKVTGVVTQYFVSLKNAPSDVDIAKNIKGKEDLFNK